MVSSKRFLVALLIFTWTLPILASNFNHADGRVKKVVTVARSGGDFSRVEDALDSIYDASKSRSYVILIEPGTYSVTRPLDMKKWVSIQGSGKESTLLKTSIGSNANGEFINGADFTSISNLSIRMRPNSRNPTRVALRNVDGCTVLDSVDISIASSSGLYPVGISADSFCNEKLLNNVTLNVSRSGGGEGAGLLIDTDFFSIENSTIVAPTAFNLGFDVDIKVYRSNIQGGIQVDNNGITDIPSKVAFFESDIELRGNGLNINSQATNGSNVQFIRSRIQDRFQPISGSDNRVSCLYSNNAEGAPLSGNCTISQPTQ